MPHKPAGLKALRQTKKRTLRNTAVKKSITYLRKQVLKAVDAKDKVKAGELFEKMKKTADKAAKRNIIPMNTAARKKSRLAKKILLLK